MRTTALVAIAVAGGCASNEPVTPDEYEDIARSVGGSITIVGGGDARAIQDSMMLAAGIVPPGFAADGDGVFHGSHDELDIKYAYALRCPDQETTQPICTPSADLAEIDLSWTGTLSLPTFSAAVTRSGQWSLAHLRSPTIVLAGTAGFGYRSATYELSYQAAYTTILIDDASRLANDGTITYQIDAAKLGTDRIFTVDAQVTFHADSSATFVLDGTHAYSLDLYTGEVAAASPI